MDTVVHPKSGEKITGQVLEAGTRIRRTDCYSSSDGEWHEAGKLLEGNTVPQNTRVVWVRGLIRD